MRDLDEISTYDLGRCTAEVLLEIKLAQLREQLLKGFAGVAY